jgi:hypothetical protein
VLVWALTLVLLSVPGRAQETRAAKADEYLLHPLSLAEAAPPTAEPADKRAPLVPSALWGVYCIWTVAK